MRVKIFGLVIEIKTNRNNLTKIYDKNNDLIATITRTPIYEKVGEEFWVELSSGKGTFSFDSHQEAMDFVEREKKQYSSFDWRH